ncbi:ATP synthase protein YMF19, partial [Cucurbita argyrosperma subsp. argyrosperma]
MPQLDKLTYFTQFFWSCLFFLTFYIPICNDGDGVLGISRILKLRNQLVSHRGNKIRSKDPNSLEDILRKGFSTVYSKYPNGVTRPSTYWEKGGSRRPLFSLVSEKSVSHEVSKEIYYIIGSGSPITCLTIRHGGSLVGMT